MAWPHPITTLGLVTGLVSGYLIAVIMSVRAEPTLLGAYFLPGGDSDPLLHGEDDRFVPAIITQLGLGALLGGLYPWVFHGLLGMEARWIISLPWTVMSGALFGAVLSLIAIALTWVNIVKFPDQGYPDLASYIMVYGLFLGILIGSLSSVWFDIFLI